MPAQSFAPPRKLVSLQILRFYAAALVVLSHLTERLQGFENTYQLDLGILTGIHFSGALGVQIFFIISGFIMGFISMPRFGEPQAPRHFLRDRLIRVVPLYWICLTAKLAIDLVFARFGSATLPANYPEQVIKSYLFIPFLDAGGKDRPILGVGWTLNFEMMFYILFALTLFLPRRLAVFTMTGAFGAMVMAHYTIALPEALTIWSEPIVLYFLIGFGMALLRSTAFRLVHLPFQALAPLILLVLYTALAPNDNNPAVNTLVAVLCVAACVLCEDRAGTSAPARLASRLGDGSYGLYLTHSLVLLFSGIAWRKLFGGDLIWVYAVLTFLTTLLVAELSYRFVERPLGRWLHQRVPGKRPERIQAATAPSVSAR